MRKIDRKIVSLSLICFLLPTSISYLISAYPQSNENSFPQPETAQHSGELDESKYTKNSGEPWLHSGGAGESVYINYPHDMTVDSIGEPETVDPHWAYDTASAELIFNVYDTLIFFNREEIPLSGQFELHIADSYAVVDSLTYRFHIRSGVQWHDPTYVTVAPKDVEYSFERALLMGHYPSWMLAEPLLGMLFISELDLTDPTIALSAVNMIDAAIEVTDATGTPDPTGEYVQFNLAMPYAPFEQILSQTWASIMSLAWMRDFIGTWNGIWPTTGADAVTLFATYNSPTVSPVDSAGNVMMGCGPYTFTEWVVGDHWKITRFAPYYLGWPAPGAAYFLDTVTEFLVPTWATRKLRFVAGDADLTDVPRSNYPEIILESNVRGTKDLPSLSSGGIFFNFAVPSGAPWMPKMGGLDKGDLMSDWHMRKAFSYSLNFAQYLQDAFSGEATQPANPIIAGLPFYDPTDPKPTYNPNLAKWHFMMAWGGTDADGDPATMGDVTPGDAWTQGFTLQLVYNTGSTPRQIAAQMWETEIQSYPFLGLVDIVPTASAWSYILPLLYSNQLPTFMMAWLADFADPHNFLVPLMHPSGDYAGHQNIAYGGSGHLTLDWDYLPGTQPPELGTAGLVIDNDYVAALIEEGVRQTAAADRNAIYRELADIYYDEAVNIMLYQPLWRHWELKWVQGWYYNPILPGYYFYHLWKGLDADLNGDQIVDFMDWIRLSAWWWDGTVGGSSGSYNRVADITWPGRHDSPIDNPPPGPSTTDTKADTAEMDGNAYLTGLTGTFADNCWEAFGIPARSDGFVDIYDAARLFSKWFVTTQEYEYVQVHGPTKLAVDPPETVTTEPFQVDITVHNVIGMLGFQFKLTYNTSVLTATGYGSYPPFEATVACEINDAQGYVSLCYSWPFPEYFGTDVYPEDPPLPICWVNFDIDNNGTSALKIENSVIADVFGEDPVGHEVFNGYYRSPPIVRVFPKVTIGPPPRIGETFNVNITISDVIDLYVWQAGMTFNASVLECLSIDEGEFLKRANVTTLWTPGTINNTIGRIYYSACSITGPGPGVNGTGQLMSITFRVKGSGNSTLHITDVLLYDSDLISITPVTIEDGYVEIHVQDIAILSVTKSAAEAYPTWTVPLKVTVVVENQGTRTETFNVTAFANLTEIGTQEITLAAGANSTLEFDWNLAGATEGTYTIQAEATILYGEIDTTDNAKVDDTVKIKHPGDANDDSIVNAYDLGILAKAWTASGGVYDAKADFNGDGVIDTLDHDILKAYWP